MWKNPNRRLRHRLLPRSRSMQGGQGWRRYYSASHPSMPWRSRRSLQCRRQCFVSDRSAGSACRTMASTVRCTKDDAAATAHRVAGGAGRCGELHDATPGKYPRRVLVMAEPPGLESRCRSSYSMSDALQVAGCEVVIQIMPFLPIACQTRLANAVCNFALVALRLERIYAHKFRKQLTFNLMPNSRLMRARPLGFGN